MKHDQSIVTQYWDKVATNFDSIYTGRDRSSVLRFLDRSLRKDMYQRFDWVMEHAGDLEGKSVCDVGCGCGRFVAEFARRGAGRVLGVDPAPRMLELARELVASEGVADKCDFVQADVLDYTAEEEYDLVVAIGLWDYIAEPTERLRRIRSLTRGKFLSAWPRFWTWRMPVRKVRLEYILGCPVYFYRVPQVQEVLNRAGFQVTKLVRVGKLFCVESIPC